MNSDHKVPPHKTSLDYKVSPHKTSLI